MLLMLIRLQYTHRKYYHDDIKLALSYSLTLTHIHRKSHGLINKAIGIEMLLALRVNF
jgi:hypothetical protein